jgi:hypothetical protein
MSCATGDRWTIPCQVGNGGRATVFRLPLTLERPAEPFCSRRFIAASRLPRQFVVDPEAPFEFHPGIRRTNASADQDDRERDPLPGDDFREPIGSQHRAASEFLPAFGRLAGSRRHRRLWCARPRTLASGFCLRTDSTAGCSTLKTAQAALPRLRQSSRHSPLRQRPR